MNGTMGATQAIIMIICFLSIPPVLFSVPSGTPTVVDSLVGVLCGVVGLVIGRGSMSAFET